MSPRSDEFAQGATYTQKDVNGNDEVVHGTERAGGLRTDRPVPPVRRQPVPYPATLEMDREAEYDRARRHYWSR